MDIQQAKMEGIVLKKGKDESIIIAPKDYIRSKAKKTTYVKGTHGSGSSKMKAAFKAKRMTRHK